MNKKDYEPWQYFAHGTNYELKGYVTVFLKNASNPQTTEKRPKAKKAPQKNPPEKI
jgi:hypothetical protein